VRAVVADAGAHHDDGNVLRRLVAAEAVKQLGATHAGHHQVEDDAVGRRALEDGARLACRLRR
jgi:hypothetical protein